MSMRFFLKNGMVTLMLGMMSVVSVQAGVEGKGAPELRVSTWVNLPEGEKSGPKIREDWKGKVIYLYFFQAWCPGCHSSGFPSLADLEKKYRGDEDVRFAAIQTVFEGYGTNTAEAAKKIVARYGLGRIPVGHSGDKDHPSFVMRDYRSRGTPWTVVIGKDGVVRSEGFHLEVAKGKALIEKLKAE